MLASDSGQAPLRHTRGPAESCFLPDLTRFTGSRCAGPDPQRLVRVVPLGGPSLEREFSPPDVGLGYRAPRAPRLARSTMEATRRRVPSCPLEGCESGRIGTLGKRVWGNSPWVRIPLPPLVRWHNHNVCAGQALSRVSDRFPSLWLRAIERIRARGSSARQTTTPGVRSAPMGVEARLRVTEGRVAAANGLDVQERWVDIASPPVRVRLLESGAGDPVFFINGISAPGIGMAPLAGRLPGRRHLLIDLVCSRCGSHSTSPCVCRGP